MPGARHGGAALRVSCGHGGLPHASGGFAAGTLNVADQGIPGWVDLLTQLAWWVERGVKRSDPLELVKREPLPSHSVAAFKPMYRCPA